jgi:BarA-like signal transduction histidine kinase
VWGLANSLNGYGGRFRNQAADTWVNLGCPERGLEAFGAGCAGYFVDLSDTANCAGLGYTAYDGSGYGISATGRSAGGYFEDAAGSAHCYLAGDSCGVVASGDDSGAYFRGYEHGMFAYVASSTYKIEGNGSVAFVQNHPQDPDKTIVYNCPEGDEVATYTRGSARLTNGVAKVPLGETFKWVTNPDIGLTAHLTPRGEWAELYVKTLTTTELVVASRDPQSNAAFDYMVYGLRIGFEEVSIVQEKQREAPIPAMTDHLALYLRRPELRQWNALERFKQMRAAVGENDPLDLSAGKLLHEAITEFDPAVHVGR